MEVWTEKYRPKKLSEVIGQKHVTSVLKKFVKEGTIPHLLFSGPAGVGKTTCALALAHELFGKNWKQNFLELNASDDRGIDTIRSKVKDFARTRPIGAGFKIILLDEADALTRDAQQALRRTMENYSETCRFILDCNYVSKIIDPIQSRCAILRFKPLEKEDVVEYLREIAKKEKLKVEKNALEAIYDVTKGDMRRAINILQACSVDKEVTVKRVYSLAALVDPKELEKVIKDALGFKIVQARDRLFDLMVKHGLSGFDVVKQMVQVIWNMEIDDVKKVSMIDAVGEFEFRMVEGSDEYLQLEALLARFAKIGGE
ncbi:MAG TPA: replication factor C small subunit [Candidatus Aenigmarchaeota archaeon]|nr:replication factor C small subunit [Candidatus Aenigmarchaeota archaeon]HEX32922.1 replication factor C small subunit [Candidatus Aenigmarchaeota archaeon]